MRREEHLKFCKKCSKRKLDSKHGFICALTGEIANFELVCNKFQLDERFIQEQKHVEINTKNIESGKKKTLIIIYTLLGFSVLSIMARFIFGQPNMLDSLKSSRGLILIVEIGLYYFLFIGKEWARSVITILLSIGFIFGTFAILGFLSKSFIAVIMFILLNSVFGYAIYYFNTDKIFFAFFNHQKNKTS